VSDQDVCEGVFILQPNAYTYSGWIISNIEANEWVLRMCVKAYSCYNWMHIHILDGLYPILKPMS